MICQKLFLQTSKEVQILLLRTEVEGTDNFVLKNDFLFYACSLDCHFAVLQFDDW